MTAVTQPRLLKGNEATVYGALLAGCECFFGYPITPASEVAHAAAELFPKLQRVFLQAESEIAAINMVMGASAAGRRAMTASSGLGISLKQECVSYLAASELPAVIVDITRGGPGLGNIGPEQSDYNQVVKGGGHGNYRCLVLAPNSVQEMCDLTVLAFDLADQYLTPVYVLADGVVGQMVEAVTLPAPQPRHPLPAWALAGTAATKHNYLTSIFLEHDELEERNRQLQVKYDRMQTHEQRSESYHTTDADLIFVAYGIVSRIARSAVDELRAEGRRVGLIRPISLFPFPVAACQAAARTARTFLCAELSNGQMIDDLRLAISCSRPVHFHGRMGGNVPEPQDLVAQAITILDGLEHPS